MQVKNEDSLTKEQVDSMGGDPLASVSPEEVEQVVEEDKKPVEEKETPQNQTEEETPQAPEAEKPAEEKSKELQSALAQKEHFRKKAEEAEKKATDALKKVDIGAANPMEIVRLAKALGDYSEQEIAFITKNAENKSAEGIIEASKDEWVQTAINATREKVADNKKIPGPSSPSAVQQDSKEKIDKLIEEKKFDEAAALMDKRGSEI